MCNGKLITVPQKICVKKMFEITRHSQIWDIFIESQWIWGKSRSSAASYGTQRLNNWVMISNYSHMVNFLFQKMQLLNMWKMAQYKEKMVHPEGTTAQALGIHSVASYCNNIKSTMLHTAMAHNITSQIWWHAPVCFCPKQDIIYLAWIKVYTINIIPRCHI